MHRTCVKYDLRGTIGCYPAASLLPESKDLVVDLVSKEILALQAICPTAIDVTANNGVADRVVIRINRTGQITRAQRPGPDGRRPLEYTPAVVGARLPDIDLFKSVSAD